MDYLSYLHKYLLYLRNCQYPRYQNILAIHGFDPIQISTLKNCLTKYPPHILKIPNPMVVSSKRKCKYFKLSYYHWNKLFEIDEILFFKNTHMNLPVHFLCCQNMNAMKQMCNNFFSDSLISFVYFELTAEKLSVIAYRAIEPMENLLKIYHISRCNCCSYWYRETHLISFLSIFFGNEKRIST